MTLGFDWRPGNLTRLNIAVERVHTQERMLHFYLSSPIPTYPMCVKICCDPFLIVTGILSTSNLDSDIEIF